MLISSLKDANGWVFDIQRYSIHDGPGIRTLIFLKGCPLCCPWCSNPESQLPHSELRFVENLCKGCKRCIEVCPVHAIRDAKGSIQFDRNLCTVCGECATVCPTKAVSIVGEVKTVSDILEVLEKDRVFFEGSGGGLTLSGGEPLAQPKFAGAIMQAAKEKGFHTAIETTGYQHWDLVKPIILNSDIVLFDIKIMDAVRHEKTVGVTNKLILENAEKIADMRKQMIIRVPIVPGFNDDFENLDKTLAFAERIGVLEVHFLPYHRLGQQKYGQLGRFYQMDLVEPPGVEKMQKLVEKVKRPGVILRIGG